MFLHDIKMETKNLLWTGGLDSTFRLLQLVLERHQKVQPFYLIDDTRPSTLMELKTIKAIKNEVYKQFPEVKNSILPTKFFAVADVAPNTEISNSFQQLKSIRHIGTQYDWLARFCFDQNLNNLELGVIKKGEVTEFGESLSQSFGGLVTEKEKHVYFFDENRIKTEKDQLHFEVFKYYHFPILHLSKKEMLAKAYENGWKEIIDLTWFCHKPKKNKPCGKCNPCRTAVSEGLGDKIPFLNRFVYDAKTFLGVYAYKKMLRKWK